MSNDRTIAALNHALAPNADRVARRWLVLLAVSARGMLERDRNASGSAQMFEELLPWLQQVDITDELEPQELAALQTPLGQLESEGNFIWLVEGAGVLGWALHKTEMQPTFEQWWPRLASKGSGFLIQREHTALVEPRLRDAAEIARMQTMYLTAHWRLREYQLRPRRINFRDVARRADWGLNLEGLNLEEDELAINGARIDAFDPAELLGELGVVSERHRALNWLAAPGLKYSEVKTAT